MWDHASSLVGPSKSKLSLEVHWRIGFIQKMLCGAMKRVFYCTRERGVCQ